jgi:hypothetical protein
VSERLLVRDKPGLWWILAFMFVGVSLALLYLGVREGPTLPWWQTALIILLGVGGTVAGLWIAAYAPLTSILIDEAGQTLVVHRRGIRGRQVHRIPVSSIRKVTIEKRDDDEGYPMTRPALALSDGEQLLLSLLWRHGEVDSLHIARSVVAAVPRLAGGDPRLTG